MNNLEHVPEEVPRSLEVSENTEPDASVVFGKVTCSRSRGSCHVFFERSSKLPHF